jgi:nucleotide-binding universal stress UspA family protein
MKRLFPTILVILLGSHSAIRAAEEATVESKLRDGLRNVMVQLRDAQNQVATLQATQATNEQKIKELTAKADALAKQAVADRNTSTNMLAEVNTKLAEQTTVNQGLQAAIDKWKRSYAELTAFTQKKEIERAKLADRVIKLDRQVQDQQFKNIAMYKLGVEILDRYEKFGLGEAVLAREPFVGATRVKFQNLIQDSQDKLVDQRIKP